MIHVYMRLWIGTMSTNISTKHSYSVIFSWWPKHNVGCQCLLMDVTSPRCCFRFFKWAQASKKANLTLMSNTNIAFAITDLVSASVFTFTFKNNIVLGQLDMVPLMLSSQSGMLASWKITSISDFTKLHWETLYMAFKMYVYLVQVDNRTRGNCSCLYFQTELLYTNNSWGMLFHSFHWKYFVPI